MRNYDLKEAFEVVTPCRMETFYGVIDKKENVTMTIIVEVSTEDEYGFFELFDNKTGGERFYGEGGLWFDGKKLTDYDGVFELPKHVTDKLKEWGFDVSYVE